MTSNQGFSTKTIHAGQNPQKWSHFSVVPPMSTTFQQDQHRGFNYSRSGKVLETCLSALEDAKYSICFSSSLGTMTSIINLLNSEDHLICGDDFYSETYHYDFQEYLRSQNITSTSVDTTDIQNLTAAIRPNTKMIWFETPTNFLLKITDIKAVADSLKSRPDIIIVVDNTFLTSYFQKPLELGAHITMYLLKYMIGHGDVNMAAAITNRKDLAKRLRFIQNTWEIPSPFDCAMVNRSLKTLELRLQQHMKNSLAVAKFLESHPCVERVLHPYLPSHPQYKLALKQSTGHNGMISFYIKDDPRKFLKALKVFNWSSCYIEFLPYTMTLAIELGDIYYLDKFYKSLGITNNLIRLSIGLETEKDLIADLKQALDACR